MSMSIFQLLMLLFVWKLFCAAQFQFDTIYSMILDFVSWSAY